MTSDPQFYILGGGAAGVALDARTIQYPAVSSGDYANNHFVQSSASAPLSGPEVKSYYFAGSQLVAVRTQIGTGGSTLNFLHSDHLGSTSLTTDNNGTVVARQLYDAWGNVRLRGDLKTDIGYTSQREDVGINLMFYRARFYSPALGRFISADSIVPGAASGSGGGAATLGVDSGSRLTTLTTDFHEFIGRVTKENQAVLQYGPFFQWSNKVRQDNPVPSGPLNPQALNRYSYCLNNPLRYVDPTGHDLIELTFEQLRALYKALTYLARNFRDNSNREGITAGTLAGISGGFYARAAYLVIVPGGQAGAAANTLVGSIVAIPAALFGIASYADNGVSAEFSDLASVVQEAMEIAETNGSGYAFLDYSFSDGLFSDEYKLTCLGCKGLPAKITVYGLDPAVWIMRYLLTPTGYEHLDQLVIQVNSDPNLK